jgi:hypothetical protein
MPRPRSVTLLAVVVLCLTGINSLGVVSAVQGYTVLSTLPLSVSPAYLVLSSAVWAVGFGVLAGGLWFRKTWARLGTPLALTLYVAQAWIERLVFGRSDFVRATVPYSLVLHLAGLALVWGLLLRRKVRQAFSD